jgi:hypothetical protein
MRVCARQLCAVAALLEAFAVLRDLRLETMATPLDKKTPTGKVEVRRLGTF